MRLPETFFVTPRDVVGFAHLVNVQQVPVEVVAAGGGEVTPAAGKPTLSALEFLPKLLGVDRFRHGGVAY